MKKRSIEKTRKNTIVAMVSIALLIIIALVINVYSIGVNAYYIRSGTDFSYYVDNVATYTTTIKAKRGTIYDANGIVIAQDEKTYDIICYLDENRKASANVIAYVDDPLYTAQMLAPILDMDYQTIYDYLTPSEYRYQVELGVKGRNLSEEKMEEIEALDLNGISFKESTSRNYPQGNSMSPYLVGFAQSDENGNLIGKMGVEQYLDEYLSGTDGEATQQVSKNGYVLDGMKQEVTPAVDGYDVYLTLDKSIQDALSTMLNSLVENSVTTKGWATVVEIETGKILAYGQTNDFDPNTLEIDDYLNCLSNYAYEPGSTFKSIIYSATMNEGLYDGDTEYNTATFYYYADDNNNPYRVSSSETYYGSIRNADYKDYGYRTLDTGLIFSLNTATSTLLCDYIGTDKYIEYVKKYGFFSKVDTDGLTEASTTLNFYYPSEKLALTYGQGSSITTLQLIQAYTAIMGNGEMVKPYYIDKIVDPSSGEIIYQREREVVDRVISEETAKQMQALLRRCVTENNINENRFDIDEVEVIGKTGTSQIFIDGAYSTEIQLTSAILGFPADNPKYIIYFAYEKDYGTDYEVETPIIKDFIRKTAILTNVGYSKDYVPSDIDIKEVSMPNMINNSTSSAVNSLENDFNVQIIGDGDYIVNQYPSAGETINTRSKVYLLTNGSNITLPDFTGWTRKEVINYWSLSKISIVLDGYGSCIAQSVEPGTIVDENSEVTITFDYTKGG